MDINNLEDTLFQFLDQVKVLFSEETWEQMLLNCTKNELLILMLLYRQSDVNMTVVAEYLHVPLNTATGIVARMEKKDLVQRVRSLEDKRVVTIGFTPAGKAQMHTILSTFMSYGGRIIATLSSEEMVLVGQIINKVMAVIQNPQSDDLSVEKKVRKINIE